MRCCSNEGLEDVLVEFQTFLVVLYRPRYPGERGILLVCLA